MSANSLEPPSGPAPASSTCAPSPWPSGAQLRAWAAQEGASDCRVTGVDLGDAPERLRRWLELGRHADMTWMVDHLAVREDPQRLLAGACRAIVVRYDYLPGSLSPPRAASQRAAAASAGPAADEGWREQTWQRLDDPHAAHIAWYARGRDYHKVIRNRLARLARRLSEAFGPLGARACVDSAPLMEVELATRAGLGWRGKHTLLLNREAGSMFFLGVLLTDLPLPMDEPVSSHCGQCEACMTVCPTQAIVAPYQLDARRCIAWLTIECQGPMPLAYRALVGNRVFGCDDCQLVCPWNRFARVSTLPDFDPRQGLEDAMLAGLLDWDEAGFEARTAGTPIRRIGFVHWQRNLVVAAGNALGRLAPDDPMALRLLQQLAVADRSPVPWLREHVAWARSRSGGHADPGQGSRSGQQTQP